MYTNQVRDPEHYAETLHLHNKLKANIANYNNFLMEDLPVYEGHEILYNRTTEFCTNSSNLQNCWMRLGVSMFKGILSRPLMHSLGLSNIAVGLPINLTIGLWCNGKIGAWVGKFDFKVQSSNLTLVVFS